MLRAIAVVLGIVVAWLAFVGFGPGFSVVPQPVAGRAPRPTVAAPESRSDHEFAVDGTTLRAWLYLPDELSAPVPAVVMAHGLGGTKDYLLEPYALRFREAGFAVMSFDYRFFGASDGEPRQLFWVPHQLADTAAAIEFVRGRPEIDAERIAVWGTSAGGGYGITLASRDPRIAAVIAQVPGLDPESAVESMVEREGLGFLLRLLVHGQRDIIRMRLGLEPHRIPLAGPPGSLALMNTRAAWDFARETAPDGYVNEVCARLVLRPYEPIEDAGGVRVPVLLQLAEDDALAPPGGGERMAAALGNLAEVQRYPIGHFDVYRGAPFERAIADQLAFLRRHLLR